MFFLVPFSCTRETPAQCRPFPALADSLSIEQSCMAISRHLMSIVGDYDAASFTSFYRVLDSTGDGLARSLGDKQKSSAAVDAIISTVYATWGIEFDNRDMAPEALLPHFVYKTKKGSCLGVSLVILMLAEKVKCPVYGVILPEHFFCRYDDGTTRFNIEPNKSGVNHPDDYYKSRYPVAPRPWYNIRRNLSKREAIGMLCYNAGAICLNLERNDAAIFYCRQAVRRLNGFPEAEGNCALAYAQKGDLDSSLALFKELFSSHPDFVNCAANYGAVLMAAKRFKTAQEVFRNGLEFYPNDTILKRGLEESKHAPKSSGDLGG
jgi:regulator of sirC expression with transglutaminase-like and TPR domain